MTKHHGRRDARVMGPTITTTRRITIPMKIGPSTPFPGFASATKVGENSPLEKYRSNVKIEPTPDERRTLYVELAYRSRADPVLPRIETSARSLRSRSRSRVCVHPNHEHAKHRVLGMLSV
jgi:hypothetical protein